MAAPIPGQEPTIPKGYAIKQGYMNDFYHISKVMQMSTIMIRPVFLDYGLWCWVRPKSYSVSNLILDPLGHVGHTPNSTPCAWGVMEVPR
jgi:hypothetical protein